MWSCGRRAGWASVLAKSRDRFLEFVLGARLVPRSVRASELAGKGCAEARPKNGDDDVGVRRLDDLGLKGRRGEERFVLPENRLEHDLADVLALQPLDDPPGQRALFEDIAGRRNEESQRLHRYASQYRRALEPRCEVPIR